MKKLLFILALVLFATGAVAQQQQPQRRQMNPETFAKERIAGIAKYDYGSFASKIDNTAAIGFSIIRFAIDDIPDTYQLIDAEGNIILKNKLKRVH